MRGIKNTVVLVWLALMPWSQVSALVEDEDVDLEVLYRQIDEAIEESPQFVAFRENKIKKQRQLFLEERELENRFLLAEQLFAIFKPYKNDSALYYARV